MKFPILKLFALFGVCAITSVQAIAADQQSLALDKRTEAMRSGPDTQSTVRFTYAFPDISGVSGGQFRIHFDSSAFEVSDISNCLANLPPTHQSTFSTCQVNEEKSFIQFIVLDLGKNRPIGSADLGFVEFSRLPGSRRALLSSGGRGSDKLFIDDIKLAGPDGKHLETIGKESRAEGLALRVLQ